MFLGQVVEVKESPPPLIIDTSIQYGDEMVALHCSTLPFITSVVHYISRCHLCKGVVDRPCGSTNRMKAHMKSKHPEKPINSTLHGQPAQSHAVTSNGKQIIFSQKGQKPTLQWAGNIESKHAGSKYAATQLRTFGHWKVGFKSFPTVYDMSIYECCILLESS